MQDTHRPLRMIIIRGKVRKGNQRGRVLGFPTANVSLHRKIPQGIYVSQIFLSGKKYNALTFIGNATTFDEKTYQSETYMLDFDQDIYGKFVVVHLLELIRQSQKFVSVDKLVKQMQRDTIQARTYFKNHDDHK